MNLLTKPFLGAKAPDKQTPSPDDARSTATGSDDPIPKGRALVATWPGGQTLAADFRPGPVDGAAGGRSLGRPKTDLLDSGNPQLAAEHPHHRVTPRDHRPPGGGHRQWPFALGAEPQLRLDSTGSRPRQRHRSGGCPAGQKPLEQGAQHRGHRGRNRLIDPAERPEALQQPHHGHCHRR